MKAFRSLAALAGERGTGLLGYRLFVVVNQFVYYLVYADRAVADGGEHLVHGREHQLFGEFFKGVVREDIAEVVSPALCLCFEHRLARAGVLLLHLLFEELPYFGARRA